MALSEILWFIILFIFIIHITIYSWFWSVFARERFIWWNENISSWEQVSSIVPGYFRHRNSSKHSECFWRIRGMTSSRLRIFTTRIFPIRMFREVSAANVAGKQAKHGKMLPATYIFISSNQSPSHKTDQNHNHNHSWQFQRTYLNKCTRYSLTDSRNLIDCSGL